MDKINRNTTIWEIATSPEFLPFGEHIMLCRRKTWSRMLKSPIAAGTATDYQADRIVRGMKRIIELRNAGEQFAYDYWDAQACVEDPTRRQTKLFFYPGKQNAPFILVISGGGYQSVCHNIEGIPTSPELADAGYNVFMLSYRVRMVPLMPLPIDDVAQAIKFILARREVFKVSEKYCVMGFSAGAHLAAEWGTDNFGYATYSMPKPSCLVLCYPPIDLRMYEGASDTRMLDSVCGGSDHSNIEDYCINLHVDVNYPRTYLWQCEDDEVVLLKNQLEMREALENAGVEYVAKTYPQGGHALMGPHDHKTDLWIEDVIAFLESSF